MAVDERECRMTPMNNPVPLLQGSTHNDVLETSSSYAADMLVELSKMEQLLTFMGIKPFACSTEFWVGLCVAMLVGLLVGLVDIGFMSAFEWISVATWKSDRYDANLQKGGAFESFLLWSSVRASRLWRMLS